MRILRLNEVTAKIGRCQTWVYGQVAKGTFPRPIGMEGGQTLGWVEAEIDRWLEALVARRDEIAASNPDPFAVLGSKQHELRKRRLERLEAARAAKRAGLPFKKKRGRPRKPPEERAAKRAAAKRAAEERAANLKQRPRSRRAETSFAEV
jgi:predicted DNA-binding transcriptional regulator AlpA